jgi:hypothetical protein
MTSFFNVVSLLIQSLFTTFNKLLYSIAEKCFWLVAKPSVHRLFDFFVTSEPTSLQCLFQRTKKVVITWYQAWRVGWMRKKLKIEIFNSFDCGSGGMWSSIVMMQKHCFRQQSSPFTANIRF